MIQFVMVNVRGHGPQLPLERRLYFAQRKLLANGYHHDG
jgi:hypothetical protein